MRTIIEIENIEEWVKDGKKHFRTHAVVQKANDPLDTEEVVGYGKDYDIGDKVEVFFDTSHNTAKMQKRDK